MEGNLILPALVAVAFATAFNLWLTFRLAARLRESMAPPFTVPLGESVPPFEGIARAQSQATGSADLAGRSTVLVFLTPGCKTCAGHVPELVEALNGAERLGVNLWIVPNDDRHDVDILVAGTPLAERVLILGSADRRRLNPRMAAPFYLFIDEASTALASSMLGDEDWRTFVEQMREAVVSPAGFEPATY
ncbi:MAG: hypothetical protein QOJ91_2840 [Sphingomonadales bacterium]|nr:hypothetical protein [Sphingomonadales bacterium]